jgi:hypothetical protein
MQRVKAFGRRAQTSQATRSVARVVRAEPVVEPLIAPPDPAKEVVPSPPPPTIDILAPTPKTVEQELEDWKEARRIKKRSFREPWRTVSIVAGIAFAPSSFLLPPEVATVADLALGVLTIGSLYAGWRGRKSN